MVAEREGEMEEEWERGREKREERERNERRGAGRQEDGLVSRD